MNEKCKRDACKTNKSEGPLSGVNIRSQKDVFTEHERVTGGPG